MSLRIRETGEILCAAHTDPMDGDTYLDDKIHYYLSQLTGAIRPSKTHSTDNLWFWNIKPEVLDHYANIINYETEMERKN